MVYVFLYYVDSCLIYHSWLSLSTYTDNTDPSNPPNGINTIMLKENKTISNDWEWRNGTKTEKEIRSLKKMKNENGTE